MRLTILDVNNYCYMRGGSERYFFDHARMLKAHGHEVMTLSTEHPDNRTPVGDYALVRPIDTRSPGLRDCFRFLYSGDAARAVTELIERKRPDVAHLHIYYGQLTASIIGPLKRAGIPIVQTLHEYKTVCPTYTLLANGRICQDCRGSSFWRAAVRRCNRGSLSRSVLSALESYVSRSLGAVRRIDHFIAVSRFVGEKVVELGLPANKVTALPHCMDVSAIAPHEATGEYFLYFGRLERLKGLFDLVEAASEVRDVPLLIAGDGEARSELEAMIASRGLDHVKLVGFKRGAELHSLIRHSLCTILPSQWYEPFGLTILESFAHCRPVIACGIGGMTEVVSDGEDGFLVPPGEVPAMRDRMLLMASDRRKAAAMGMAGRSKIEALYSPRAHYDGLMRVYEKVVCA